MRSASFSIVVPARIDSSRLSSTPGTATTWSSKNPLSHAAAAASWERSANSSWSSRVTPSRSRSCSVASPSETVHAPGISGLTSRHPSAVETSSAFPAGNARLGFCITQGERDIDSTPPTSTTSDSPSAICREPVIVASRLEPQSRFTVVAGTDTGSPASSPAIRATLRLSSPAPLALPSTISSTCAGSSSGLRSTTVRSTSAARSSGRVPASAPPYLPNGVRTAS